MEATNQAYIERGRVAETDPYIDTIGSVKGLIALMFVVASMTLLAFAFWGK
jgi:hypothetical protein